MKRNFITENLWLKLASIFLAVILWFFVMSSGRSVIIKEVPVQYINMPQSLEMVDMARNVSVVIEGQKRLLSGLNQGDINVVVDLENMQAGENSYSLSKKNIKLPKSLSITSISPETLKLTLEERLKKEVSVKPVIAGSPEEGFAVESIKITPERVQIEGPKSLIRRTFILKTEPIDISGIYEDLQHAASLDVAPNIKTNVRGVKVDITVRKKR
ncbi:MAG: CdaR family protein [Nitrospirota bacterium]